MQKKKKTNNLLVTYKYLNVGYRLGAIKNIITNFKTVSPVIWSKIIKFRNKHPIIHTYNRGYRSRPKTRPDWSAMLKDLESERKLKHVECNDRSKPLLPKVKAKGQFLYDSEKQNAHNVLLKEVRCKVGGQIT